MEDFHLNVYFLLFNLGFSLLMICVMLYCSNYISI